MFESKYIKYDPSITCEIFDKIINRLTELYGKSNRWKENYDQFKTWGFIVIFNAPTKSHFNWGVDNNKQNGTEITVQELLGYDPFISDNLLERWLKETKDKSFSLYGLETHISSGITCPYEKVYLKLKGSSFNEKAKILYDLWNSKEFTLPSKWRVLATSEAEGKLLIPYANEGFKSPNAWNNGNVQNYWLCVGPGKFNSLSKNSYQLSEYEEITFVQFKQYVLKENSVKTGIDWTKCTQTELQAEAEKRYPIGTKCISLDSMKNECVIKSLTHAGSNSSEIFNPCVYKKGSWAEIVKEIQPKEWAIDTYVVFLKDYGGHSKGTVDKIIADINPMNVKVSLPFDGSGHCNLSKSHEAKWFATKSEAETFVKTQLKESGSTEEDLTGRYLRAIVDRPQSTSLKKGDIIKIVSKQLSNRYFLEKSWVYTTGDSTSSDFEVLPKEYKPESTSLNLNFQHNQFYKVTLLKHSYVFLFTDSKLEKERINVVIYYDCSNKKCGDGGFIYLKDITACEWIPFETVKRDYSELYCKIYLQPKYQYEEGKWYSVVKDQLCNNFRKCSKSSNNNVCTYDEMIYNGKHSKQHGNAAWDIAFPADMSVINKLIEQAKIQSKFEEGKWYSQDASGAANNFRKCSKSSNNNILTYDERITLGKWEKDPSSAYWSEPYLADMDVVNKIINDTISQNESIPEYKVNDWIIVIKECQDFNGKLGQLYKVIGIVDYKRVRINKSVNIDIERVKTRLATSHEIELHLKSSKVSEKSYKGYSIGDYITIVRHPKFWSSLCVNKNLLDKVTYPFTAEITKLTIEHGDCGIEAGSGGWSLDHMLKDGTVRKATSEEIDNAIHKELDDLLNIPGKFTSEHSITCQSKPKKDEFEFIMLPEE